MILPLNPLECDCFISSITCPVMGIDLARIIHQLEQSTREDPFGGWMLLNPPVSQDHHAPKARASEGLDRVQSGLSAAIRRTSA